jgi:hypothetical protein
MRRWAAWACGIYVAALAVLFVAGLLLPAESHANPFCYWKRGEMVPYVQCVGTGGAFMGFLFNLPASLFWAPVFGLMSLPTLLSFATYSLGMAVLLWAPILYLTWYVWRLRKQRAAQTQASVANDHHHHRV